MPLFKSKPRMSETENGEVRFQVDCKYIGSQAIDVVKKGDHQRVVDEILHEIKENVRGVSVILVISTEGIKTYDKNGKTVKLAHAITKVASSTCNPEARLFAYVARSWQSNGIFNIQAHIFRTKRTSHAQQLGTFASRAFRLAVSRATIVRDQARINFDAQTATEELEKPAQVTRKRWAKKELAKGHDYSEHANRARVSSGALISQRWQEDASFYNTQANLNSPPSSPPAADQIIEHPVASAPPSEISKSSTSSETLENNHSIDDVTADNTIGSQVNEENNHSVYGVTVVEKSIDAQVNREPDSSPSVYSEIEAVKEIVASSSPDAILMSSNSDSVDQVTDCVDGKMISEECILNGNSNEKDKPLIEQHKSAVDMNGYKQVFSSTGHETHSPSPDSQGDENNEQEEPYDIPVRKISYIIPEEDLLDASDWFQEGLTRELCEEVLADSPAGGFLVRASQSNVGSYGMSLCCQSVPDFLVRNFLIMRLEEGKYQIQGCTAVFDTLTSLIAHYASCRDELPIELRLGENNPLYFERQMTEGDDFNMNKNEQKVPLYYEVDDPDYNYYCNSETIMNELQRCASINK